MVYYQLCTGKKILIGFILIHAPNIIMVVGARDWGGGAQTNNGGRLNKSIKYLILSEILSLFCCFFHIFFVHFINNFCIKNGNVCQKDYMASIQIYPVMYAKKSFQLIM